MYILGCISPSNGGTFLKMLIWETTPIDLKRCKLRYDWSINKGSLVEGQGTSVIILGIFLKAHIWNSIRIS